MCVGTFDLDLDVYFLEDFACFAFVRDEEEVEAYILRVAAMRSGRFLVGIGLRRIRTFFFRDRCWYISVFAMFPRLGQI